MLLSHSRDGVLGWDDKAWGEDLAIEAAFKKFNVRLKEIEGIINDRMPNLSLKNGFLLYQLLKAFLEPNVTGLGVASSQPEVEQPRGEDSLPIAAVGLGIEGFGEIDWVVDFG